MNNLIKILDWCFGLLVAIVGFVTMFFGDYVQGITTVAVGYILMNQNKDWE